MIQQEILQQFMQQIGKQQLSHAYLFVGPRGSGKYETALAIAQALFCQNVGSEGPCGTCTNCQRIAQGDFPDVVTIAPEGANFKVAQTRQLTADMSRSAIEGGQKVFVLQDVSRMTVSAANSLLLALEEPKTAVVLFLLSDNKEAVLPTIRSRCQTVLFQAPPLAAFVQQLQAAGVSAYMSAVLAPITHSVAEAVHVAQQDWVEPLVTATWHFFEQLVGSPQQAFATVQVHLVPFLTDRSQQQYVLRLVTEYAHDLLLVRHDAMSKVAFVHHLPAYQKLVMKQSHQATLDLVSDLLTAEQQLAANVSAQAVFEAVTLR